MLGAESPHLKPKDIEDMGTRSAMYQRLRLQSMNACTVSPPRMASIASIGCTILLFGPTLLLDSMAQGGNGPESSSSYPTVIIVHFPLSLEEI